MQTEIWRTIATRHEARGCSEINTAHGSPPTVAHPPHFCFAPGLIFGGRTHQYRRTPSHPPRALPGGLRTQWSLRENFPLNCLGRVDPPHSPPSSGTPCCPAIADGLSGKNWGKFILCCQILRWRWPFLPTPPPPRPSGIMFGQ